MAAPRAFGNYEILSPEDHDRIRERFDARIRSGARAGQEVTVVRLTREIGGETAYATLFQEDTQRAMTLRHPAVAEVLDAGSRGDVQYVVMERVAGWRSSEVVERSRSRSLAIPVEFALCIAEQLLDGVAGAHGELSGSGGPKALVHGHLSTSEVFITPTGEVKIYDFGFAKLCARLVRDGAWEPLPPYASPSMLEGRANYAADLWAVSAVVYELLTLSFPFRGKTKTEVHRAIRENDYRPIRDLRPEVSGEVDAFVYKGFRAGHDDGYRSAQDMNAEVGELFDHGVGTPLGIASLVRGLFAQATSSSPVGTVQQRSRPGRHGRIVLRAASDDDDADAPTERPRLLDRTTPPPPKGDPPRKVTVPERPEARSGHDTPTLVRAERPKDAAHRAATEPETKGAAPPPLPPPAKHKPKSDPKLGLDWEIPKPELTPKRPAKAPAQASKANLHPEEAVGSILGAEAKFQRGMALLQKRSLKKAHHAFKEAVDLSDAEAESHAYLGWSAFLLTPKNRASALQSLARASELDPNLDMAYLFRGLIESAAGHHDVAKKEYEKALQVNPDCEAAERELRKLSKAKA